MISTIKLAVVAILLSLSSIVHADTVNNIVITSSGKMSYNVDYSSREIKVAYNGDRKTGQKCKIYFWTGQNGDPYPYHEYSGCKAKVPLSLMNTVSIDSFGYSVSVFIDGSFRAWTSFKGYP